MWKPWSRHNKFCWNAHVQIEDITDTHSEIVEVTNKVLKKWSPSEIVDAIAILNASIRQHGVPIQKKLSFVENSLMAALVESVKQAPIVNYLI